MDWITAVPGAIAGGALGVAGALLSIWRKLPVLETRIDAMEKSGDKFEAEMTAEFRDAVAQLNLATATIKALAEVQSVQSAITTTALRGLTDRQDEHIKMLAMHQAKIEMWASQ